MPLVTAAAVLASQHAPFPMLDSFRWAAAHYSSANAVPYGFEPVAPLAQSGPGDSALHRLLIAIPVTLPFVAACV